MKCLTFLGGCLIVLCAPLAQWIAPECTATKAAGINSLLPEPIKITAFTLKMGQNQPGKSASENDSWMNSPLLEVENISSEAIKYLVLEISFPDAESFQFPFMLGYGQAPGQKPGSKLAEVLEPGAKVNLSVGQNAHRGFRSHLLASGMRLPSGSRMMTRINGVIFANGTGWFDGLLHKPDQNNPLRWYVVGKSPTSALSNPAPGFRNIKASYSPNRAPASAQECWDRVGTEWLSCCDGALVVASAILVPDRFGLYQPYLVSFTCSDGSTCEYYKQVGCF